VFEEVKYETKPGDWIRRAPRKYLERLALAHSRNLIAVSEYVRRTIQSLTHARIVVIENPVEERFFRVGEARLNTARANATRERVLFVGAINPRKNILDLLRAVTLALQAGTDLELRIAGGVQDPSYHDVLQRFVREESLQDRVRFLGQLSDTALLSEYECCALVASASHEETAGMVFQQAMAAGAPVLGTRVGGVPFVVRDGETGFLVEPGNLGQLAAALCQLVGSPELRMHLGAAGRRIALERFTTAIAATRTTALYEEMLLGAASVSASRRA
jgi:glycosyltransferase involved in cell wall biosynthesis